MAWFWMGKLSQRLCTGTEGIPIVRHLADVYGKFNLTKCDYDAKMTEIVGVNDGHVPLVYLSPHLC
jgi:hypothetical protein